ncbi:Oxygen sensor histidine kinase NreB [Halioglobus japonicus]|nr:Oxygen sensor histidine kinase NreB [Halioglobus japonicus]
MSADLKKQAEALLQKNPLETPVVETAGIQQLVQDLWQRQIELERQNQALRNTQATGDADRSDNIPPHDAAPPELSGHDPTLFAAQLERLVEQRSAELRETADTALRESEARYRSTVQSLLVGVVVHAADHSVIFSNPQACQLLGLSLDQMQGKQSIPSGWQYLHEDRTVVDYADYPMCRVIATGKSFAYECMGVWQPGRTDITWLTGSAIPVFTPDKKLDRIVVNFMDITELKRLQQALQKRVLALTHPLAEPEGIAFDDLFNLSEIQRIQDEFSTAAGVASIIVDAQGNAITEPSNFVDLCQYMSREIQGTVVDYFSSPTVIERSHPQGPVIRQCPSSGLWDAGAAIEIDGQHVATWLIGQVRDELWTEEQVHAYARGAGSDEAEVIEAFYRTPAMSGERFRKIAQALFTLARQISTTAYQNVQQARFIEEQKRTSQALHESQEKYRKLFESESDAIMIFDYETRQFVDVNDAATKLYGYTREEFLQLKHSAVTAEPAMAEELIPLVRAEKPVPAFVTRHRKKDGSVFPIEITAFSFTLRGRVVLCGVIRDNTERVAYETEREKNREELRRLASELSLAGQRERERIGQEIHDGVSQLLSSSLLRLNVLKESPLSADALDSLDTVCGIVKEALDETRSLTFELSCPMLNELGLSAALEELCSSMTHEHSIHFAFEGGMLRLPISMDRKIALYRSTRELLINVMKHSGAKRAGVHLEHLDDCVRISVRDDGVGFDATMAGKGFSPSGGFGLFNIREYIRHPGGSLHIESIPGEGTEVVLSVPLEGTHESQD